MVALVRLPNFKYSRTARIRSSYEYMNYLQGSPSFRPHLPWVRIPCKSEIRALRNARFVCCGTHAPMRRNRGRFMQDLAEQPGDSLIVMRRGWPDFAWSCSQPDPAQRIAFSNASPLAE